MKGAWPVTSPSPQIPSTSVSSRPFTGRWPRSSVARPVAPSSRASVLGRRPAATSRWLPSTVSSPSGASARTATPPSRGSTDVASVPVSTRTPSSSRISSIASATSSSSRSARRSARSRIVTSAPKRRNIWPNSRPMNPPPSTTRCSGTSPSSITDVESRNSTSSSPGTGGTRGRAPVSTKTRSARSRRVPPSRRSTSSSRVPTNRASPKISSRPSVSSRPRRAPSTHESTMSRFRRRTVSMSTETPSVSTP